MKIKYLLSAIFILISGSVFAEINPIGDKNVIHGKLDNGLTYYILPSKNSGNQADFFLARSVGSVNEEEDERGLAHFLEHLCFNGSKHFPGNAVISYLESVGVKFGKNLNAFTSADRTVYNISKVPTTRQSTLDSCLLILRDWSGDLTLSSREIEAERSVIHEEWRQRNAANNRLLTKALPSLFPGSRYGNRMPIGLMETVDNCSAKTIRDFYKRWHRPDNQAIIVVGDVNPSLIETKIKQLFASLPKPKNTPSPSFDIPENESLISVVETDPEQPVESLTLYLKYKRPNTLEMNEDMKRELTYTLLQNMLLNRFDDMELAENSVCSNIGIGDQKYILASPVRALMIRSNIAPGKSRNGLSDIYSILRSASIYGFSDEELEEAKANLLSTLTRQSAKSSLRSNTDLANRLVRTYLDGERFDTPESRLKSAKVILPVIKASDVQNILSTLLSPQGKNMVVLCYAPQYGTDIETPDPEALKAAFLAVNDTELFPYEAYKTSFTLLDEEPIPGSVLSSEIAEPFGMEKITLSNGIKVYLKKTLLKEDEILVRGIGSGGLSQRYSPEVSASMKLLEDIIPLCGFGNLSSSDLRRFSHGRNMKVASMISNTEETLEFSSDSADLEDAFRLLYLKATDIRKDSTAFNAFAKSKKHSLSRIYNNPIQVMGDSITSIIYSHNPLGRKVNLSTLENFNLDTALDIYRDRFSDFSDFTFYVTGDFDRDRIVNLLRRYVASLPANGRVETPKDINYRFPAGNNLYEFSAHMENPLGIVYQFRNIECPYTLDNILGASATGSILKSKLLSDLREDKGWTYSITGHGAVVKNINGVDPSVFMMPVHIKTSPEHVEDVDNAITSTVKRMGNGDISEEEVNKVRQYFLKNIKENRDENAYWLVAMHCLNKYGLDLDTEYEDAVQRLTPSTISSFIRTYVLPSNLTILRMTPAEK